MSLRGLIALLVSTAVLLTCGVMFGINIVFDRNQTIAKGDSGLRLLALHVSSQLTNRFDNVSGKADQLSRRVSENTPAYSKEIYDLMEQYYGLDPDIFGGAVAFDEQKFSERQRLFCLFIAKGETPGTFIRGRLPPEYDYLDPSVPNNSWFTVPKATGRPAWTLPFFDDGGTNAWILTYATPFTKNGEFAGTVNVDISLNSPVQWMDDVLSNSPSEVTEYGSCFLTDSAGVLVSHTNTQAVESRKNIKEYLTAESREAASHAEEDGAVVRARNYFDGSGDWVRVAKIPVGQTGWYLYAITNENAALRDFYGRLNRSLIWMAIMLAAFLWSLRWFTRRLTAPLINAAVFATRLRDGHLGDRMESPYQLECKHLVNALNDMAETLEKRTLEKEKALQTQDAIFRHVTVVAEKLTQLAVDIHLQSEEGVRDANNQQSTFSEFGTALGAFGTHTSHTAAASSRADQLLQDARERAEAGTVEMGRLTSAMSDLIKASSDISRVVKTIDAIAFQTNLLSLNAAVEAAHAGKHGKGFGVVAEEVRQLANRSARAATETNEMLSHSEHFAEDGVNAGRQTTETLATIRGTTENVAALISEVAKLSQEQATMVEQILSGLVHVEQIADGNRKRAERESSAAEELRNTAEALREMLLASKE